MFCTRKIPLCDLIPSFTKKGTVPREFQALLDSKPVMKDFKYPPLVYTLASEEKRVTENAPAVKDIATLETLDST
jgi:hypothetical protein